MTSKEEFVFIKIISLLIIIFVLVFISINSLSIKVLALNKDSVTIPTLVYDNELINNRNNSLMLPGSNMTFGSSLDNAKMHLMEAIMDLKENNIDGALIQLNITSDNINMHEQEMSDMMKMMDNIEEIFK